MILSTNQPYFSPFAGFFLKAHRSDVFILLDNVQFPRGTTWMSRNRFKNDQGTLWMTIPVCKKGLGLQAIDAVKICREGRWRTKYPASLAAAYANAPYYRDHVEFIQRMFSPGFERLVDLNLAIIDYLMEQLGVVTEVRRASELGVQQKGSALLVEICRRLGASTYLTRRCAAKYLDVNLFRTAGIRLRTFEPSCRVYPQLWGDFIADLSAFDLLFNCGPKAHAILTAG